MNGPKILQQNIDILKTSMGACFPGSHAIFRGHDLHRELRDMDWVGLYIFGITGRRFTREQLRLLHAMWVHTSYPDARIWNNRLAALAGTARSTSTLAVSAALAVSEATIYGVFPMVRSIDFLMRARNLVDEGEQLEIVIRNEMQLRRIYGYGRPINSSDERLPWLLGCAAELALDQGPHLKLAFEVERILLAGNKSLKMNYAALAAALSADIGLSVKEFQLFVFPMFLAGMPPCFLEAEQKKEGTLFPMQCNHILYNGAPKRKWLRHK